MATFFWYICLASLLGDQSANFLAASSFLVFFMMPVASMSQPRPSLGNTRSIGAPPLLTWVPRYSSEIPMGNTPLPADLQGLEPECMYCAMFSCKASIYFQPPCSPNNCSQALTSKYPVPHAAQSL